MEKIRSGFSKLSESYKYYKSHFESTLESWRVKGYLDDYNRVKIDLNELESLMNLLSEELEKKNGNADAEFLRSKLKRAKKLFKSIKSETRSPIIQWTFDIIFLVTAVVLIKTFVFTLYTVTSGSAEHNILIGDKVYGNKLAYLFKKVERGDQILFHDAEFSSWAPKGSLNYYWQRSVGFGIPMLGLKEGPVAWVKRVIAIPGDTIEGKVEDGKPVVYLNDKKLEEPYVNEFPLIAAYRPTGIFNRDTTSRSIFSPFIDPDKSFTRYVFDPSKPLNDQPFYDLKKEDIILHPFTGSPLIWEANKAEDYDVFPKITLPEGKYWTMGDNRRNSKDSRMWGLLDESLIMGKASFTFYSIDSEEYFWPLDIIKHPIEFWTKRIRWNRFFAWIK